MSTPIWVETATGCGDGAAGPSRRVGEDCACSKPDGSGEIAGSLAGADATAAAAALGSCVCGRLLAGVHMSVYGVEAALACIVWTGGFLVTWTWDPFAGVALEEQDGSGSPRVGSLSAML